jgi:hypothetical protein
VVACSGGEDGGQRYFARLAAVREAEVRPPLDVPPELTPDAYDSRLEVEVLFGRPKGFALAQTEAEPDVDRELVAVLKVEGGGAQGERGRLRTVRHQMRTAGLPKGV